MPLPEVVAQRVSWPVGEEMLLWASPTESKWFSGKSSSWRTSSMGPGLCKPEKVTATLWVCFPNSNMRRR